MVLDQDEGVHDLAQGDALGVAPAAEAAEGGFEVLLGLVAEPAAEVVVDVVHATVHLVGGKAVVGRGPRVAGQVPEHLPGQVFRVVLDELDQAGGEHDTSLK
jgi:hypothetical protein